MVSKKSNDKKKKSILRILQWGNIDDRLRQKWIKNWQVDLANVEIIDNLYNNDSRSWR